MPHPKISPFQKTTTRAYDVHSEPVGNSGTRIPEDQISGHFHERRHGVEDSAARKSSSGEPSDLIQNWLKRRGNMKPNTLTVFYRIDSATLTDSDADSPFAFVCFFVFHAFAHYFAHELRYSTESGTRRARATGGDTDTHIH